MGQHIGESRVAGRKIVFRIALKPGFCHEDLTQRGHGIAGKELGAHARRIQSQGLTVLCRMLAAGAIQREECACQIAVTHRDFKSGDGHTIGI